MTDSTKHSSRKHSEFAPSSSHRWMTCPGSVRLSRTAPPQIETHWAREGTEAHECLEFLVRRFGNLDLAIKQASNKWPSEMVWHGVAAAKQIFKLRPSKHAKLLVETRVQLRQISHRLFGTLDYAWVEDFGTLTVIDYKYGAGHPVFPFMDEGEPNPQLMYYAAGIAHLHDYEFERVQIAIIQPRVWQAGEDPVSIGEVSVKAVRQFEGKVKEAMARANKVDAPLVAGDHCRWCPAAATCPETSKNAMANADIVFDVESGVSAVPEPLALTSKTLPRLLEACDRLETWIDAVRERAKRMAEDGQNIPGYKLVAKRAQRVWLPEAETRARELFGEDAYETPPKAFLSPAQLERRHGPKAKAFTEEHTVAVSSGFHLVPASDRRAEVKETSDFDFV